jgi:hypothetical protein
MKELTTYMKAYIDMLQLSYDLYCDAMEDLFDDLSNHFWSDLLNE